MYIPFDLQSFLLILIKLLAVCYTVISFVGILVNTWTVFDSKKDLSILKKAEINNLIEKTGRISYRDAIAKTFMHVIFFSLGLFTFFGPASTLLSITRLVLIVIYTILINVAQSFIVIVQLINQVDRIDIRNQLIESDHGSMNAKR